MPASPHPSIRTIDSLGTTIYETKPNKSNLVAGVIIAMLLVGGGCAISWFMLRQMFFPGVMRPRGLSNWLGAVFFMLLGVAMVAGGVLLFRWVKSLFRFRLRVSADGFCIIRGGTNTVFAWQEIAEVQEKVLHEKLPLVKGVARRLMPTKTSRHYTVVRCDAEKFYFDENVIPRTSLLAGPLAGTAKQYGFSWETREVS